ncbi:hypothetical protein KOI35_01320 [Actinoplanes bogorensis]|uniref:HEAT repeat domain-containing protein n=1 Tax=Paractinoplanes bogorensis TaxID=1610840 RepID=A0ABS5YFP8_9ACTN|nr:hypothetical protein [Actinoplanes bogorensis]MBU2662137.1 hypothetical protein [Actinoplanes bogorensis]
MNLREAADGGDLETVSDLLEGRYDSMRPEIVAAIGTARAWLDGDEGDELRRRLDLPAGAGQVTRERLAVDDQHVTRLVVTAPDGRSASVLLAHRAVLTELEHAIGLDAPRDEVMERGLHHDDPESQDWYRAIYSFTSDRNPTLSFEWAAVHIADERTGVRRFVADVLFFLLMAEPPFIDAAADLIRPRLALEDDSWALQNLLSAYTFHQRGPRPEVTAHAGHPDPRVRVVVAGALPANDPLLLQMRTDPDDRVRQVALFNAGM